MTPVHSFFIELLNRIRTKSPKFFLILSIIGAALTGLGWLPTMLRDWFNIEMAPNFVVMCQDIAKYATGFFAASVLPVKSVPVGQTPEGSPIIVTDEKKLPFTAKAEDKRVEETVPPPPVVNVPEK